MLRRILALAPLALVFAGGAAHAAPHPIPGAPEIAGVPAKPPPSQIFVSRSDALAQLAKIVAWDKSMQSLACVDPDAGVDAGQEQCRYGGIIEVESGPGNDVVESDNTQEGVFNWSFDRALAMDATYAPQITNAFEYLATHPGWLEWRDGGGTAPNSYSVYNCGWGVRAVIEYEAATGDKSHHDYGVSCAQHIHDYAGVTPNGTLIDAATSGWAAAGLWQWGVATSDDAMKAQAATIGGEVKAWIDVSPMRVASRTWAVTGGATFYGVVGSYMQAHPSELGAWAASIAPQLAGWIDSSQPIASNWTDWRNAHSAWNMLAQFTAADALGGADGDAHRQIALDVLAKLLAQDTDADGAIPGSQQRPATEDQSWITAYLVYFGLRPVIAASPIEDAGAPDAGAVVDSGVDASGGAAAGGASSSGCACALGGAKRQATYDYGAGGALAALALALARRRSRS